MRTTLSRWTALAVVGFSMVSFTGCQTGSWGMNTPSWLSWNKKAPATNLSNNKPSSNFLPSPSSTLANNAGSGANPAGGSPGYATTGQPAANYGYNTGGYNTGAAAGQTASRGYGAAPTGSPYGAANTGYGAANAGYGGAPGSGADGYRTADQRGGYGTGGYGTGAAAAPNNGATNNWNSPATNAPPAGPNYNAPNSGYAGASGGYAQPPVRPAANTSVSPWSTPPAGGDGHDHSSVADGSANRGAAPARDGGYRPGSTGRVKPIDNSWRQEEDNVQPATFNRTPQGGNAYGDDAPAGGNGGAYTPPTGNYAPPAGGYQP